MITLPNSCTHKCQRLHGKVAIVTASTEGIGFAIAERLASEGAKVMISSRKIENVNRAVNALHKLGLKNVDGLKCHVANGQDRKKLFDTTIQKFGGIDILISNAAANPAIGPVLECPEEIWDKVFDVNVKSSFLLAKEALPYIRKRGPGGSIIFISSIAGFRQTKGLGVYGLSKTALFGLTKAIANDLAKENIRVNCVAPGLIRTNFARARYETKAANDAALATIPMGRLGESTEIAGLVGFLVSDDASYITGEIIVASGGATSRL